MALVDDLTKPEGTEVKQTKVAQPIEPTKKTAKAKSKKQQPVKLPDDATKPSTTTPKLVGKGTHESVPRTAKAYHDAMTKAGIPSTVKEAEEILQSVKGWANTAGYGLIRENQQLGIFDQDAENIEKFIKNSTPYKGDVYRGISFRTESEAMEWAKGKNGVLDNQSALASWTSDLKIAEEFAEYGKEEDGNPYAVIIKSANKTGASIRNLSKFNGELDRDEAEVVVSKGTRHKVKKVTKKEGYILVETEEV